MEILKPIAKIGKILTIFSTLVIIFLSSLVFLANPVNATHTGGCPGHAHPSGTAPTLQIGSNDTSLAGDPVHHLQTDLLELNFNPGPLDGIFGTLTQAAVINYQASNPPLSADGVVGPLTWTAIGNSLIATCGGGGPAPPGGGGVVNILPGPNILPRIDPFAAVGAFVRLVLIAGFVVALFYFLFGAIRYITSGGDKAALEAARGHLANAIIGLVILLSVFAILFFIETFFGVSILTRGQFVIPTVPHLP